MDPESPYRTVSSEVVLKTPWFAIERDEVQLGRASGVYWVMRRPAFAACVVRNERDEILCVQNWRYPVGKLRWELPQGSADAADLHDVARAEVMEETGVAAQDVRLLGELHEAYGYSDARCAVFVATAGDARAARPEPLEAIEESRWFSTDEFWALVAAGTVSDAISIAAVAMWEREGRS